MSISKAHNFGKRSGYQKRIGITDYFGCDGSYVDIPNAIQLYKYQHKSKNRGKSKKVIKE